MSSQTSYIHYPAVRYSKGNPENCKGGRQLRSKEKNRKRNDTERIERKGVSRRRKRKLSIQQTGDITLFSPRDVTGKKEPKVTKHKKETL